MSADNKAAELVKELNAFAEDRFNQGQYAEAEERFRTALDVYHQSAKESGNRHTAVLATISGLVKALEAQGRQHEAARVLESEEPTIAELIGMLREQVGAG